MIPSYSSIIPSIERRLSAWMEVEERLGKAQTPISRPTITLSRQFGCEGFPLAERLQNLLEAATGESWNIYDKSLIEQVAQDEKLSLRLLRNLGDSSHLFDKIGEHFLGYHSHHEAFSKVAQHILRIGKMGNAILVGRGGAVLCKELPNAYHFRLEASLEWRVQSIQTRLGLDPKMALKMVKENSKLREQFISECLHTDIGKLEHYDAIFNNERHSIEQTARAILAYLQADWPDPAFFKF